MSKDSARAYGYYRTWSENDSHANFLKALLKLKNVEYFKFVFDHIGSWSSSFLQKCMQSLFMSSVCDPRKKKVDLSAVHDNTTLDVAWKHLLHGPVSEMWSLTACQNLGCAALLFGRESFVSIFKCVSCFIIRVCLQTPTISIKKFKENWQTHGFNISVFEGGKS